MPQKRKTPARRAKAPVKKLRFKGSRLSLSNLLIFAIIFALIGGYIIWRSFAASAGLLTASNLDMTHSTDVLVMTETTIKSKRNSNVVQLVQITAPPPAPSLPPAVAAFTNPQLTLDTGVYQACLYALVPDASASINGELIIRSNINGALGNVLGQTNYTLNGASDYANAGCMTFTNVTANGVVEALVTNQTPNVTERIGHILLKKIANLPPPPPTTPLPTRANGNTDALPSKLVFDDEFNGTGLDKTRWAPVWFNDNATQNGTHMKASNVSVSGGFLNLAIASDGTGAIVSSNPTAPNGQSGYTGYQYANGYAEARICLPAASNRAIANWPAWWTDGQNWPQNGEQDIMEGLGGSAEATWHGPTSDGHNYGNGGALSGCHVFASNWQKGIVTSYYDGQKLGSYANSGVGSDPQYLILENSNGSYGGQKVNGVTMQVDYVRVWQ